jgi:formylglycine-generating enzyme required for sulfatase activity
MIGRVGYIRQAVMRPSDSAGNPLAALAAALVSPTALPELAGVQNTPSQLASLLREALSQAGKKAGLAETAEARLVIVVDQLEEIFTIDQLDQADREAFVAALDTLAKSGLVWVVATMRSDFFDRLETMPALASLSVEGQFLLLPPDEAEIGQIIRQPAQEAGLRFEHDALRGVSLDEVIRQAAIGDRGALPLLSFLLDQLWQKRSDTGLLSFAAYQELGGLEGAIGRRAEEVFQAQPNAVRRELMALLRELVTDVQGGRAVLRAASLPRFPPGSPRRALADAFLNPGARLFVSDGDAAPVQLRLAQEAKLPHRPRAEEQVNAEARDLELRRRLEQGTEHWRASRVRREKRGQVVVGLPAEARALLARRGVDLPAEISEFAAGSRRSARWRRLRLWGIVAAALPPVVLVAGIIWAGLVWWGVRQVEAEWAEEHEFVPVKAGCFDMGSSGGGNGAPANLERYPNEGPVHNVCVKPFDLAKFAVTQGEWRRVMIFPNAAAPSFFQGSDRLPVETVNWDEAQRFVWLMSFFGHGHYRLPSEAEYEYAARAGTTTSRYWGDNIDDGCAYENIADRSLKKEAPDIVSAFANCDDGYFPTAPVGSFKPNPWGLYDMLGNVANWVEDCYLDSYIRTPSDGSPNTSGACTNRVVRGGSWSGIPRFVRATGRISGEPLNRYGYLGFRLARTITP